MGGCDRKGGSQVSGPQWVAALQAKGWPSLHAKSPPGADEGEVLCTGRDMGRL